MGPWAALDPGHFDGCAMVATGVGQLQLFDCWELARHKGPDGMIQPVGRRLISEWEEDHGNRPDHRDPGWAQHRRLA